MLLLLALLPFSLSLCGTAIAVILPWTMALPMPSPSGGEAAIITVGPAGKKVASVALLCPNVQI